MLLEGRTALVTGAASGLGRAIATRFAAEGATVVLLDRDEAGLDESLAAVQAAGAGAHLTTQVDLTDDAAIKAAIARLDRLDVLVNSAGVAEPAGTLSLGAEDFHRTISINLGGTFFCCQAAANGPMRAGGAIVNIASIAGLVGFGGDRAVYAASKAGVLGLTRALAKDLGDMAIRVNAICPGVVHTPMTEMFFEDPQHVEELLNGIPLRKLVTADDIAQTALFLASDMSASITGVAIPVDGGITATRARTAADRR